MNKFRDFGRVLYAELTYGIQLPRNIQKLHIYFTSEPAKQRNFYMLLLFKVIRNSYIICNLHVTTLIYLFYIGK